MPERDYPEGHPAAHDYRGQSYTPPKAPFAEDFPVNHPARGGNNMSDTDTPDGFRELQAKQDAARLIPVVDVPVSQPLANSVNAGEASLLTNLQRIAADVAGDAATMKGGK